MTQRDARRWRELRGRLMREDDPGEVVDIMLALDRMVVELSLRVYRVPHRDRLHMREHNRRLHHAVRQHLPQMLEKARNRS